MVRRHLQRQGGSLRLEGGKPPLRHHLQWETPRDRGIFTSFANQLSQTKKQTSNFRIFLDVEQPAIDIRPQGQAANCSVLIAIQVERDGIGAVCQGIARLN